MDSHSHLDLLGDVKAVHAEIADNDLVVTLSDGRRISTPLDWYDWLREASPEQRANIHVPGDAVEWPDLDQGVDVEWMLRGAR